jgi:hypothetical protein
VEEKRDLPLGRDELDSLAAGFGNLLLNLRRGETTPCCCAEEHVSDRATSESNGVSSSMGSQHVFEPMVGDKGCS